MTAPGTHFNGPLISGSRAGEGGAADVQGTAGFVVLGHTALLTQNGANNVSATMYIPKHSRNIEFAIQQLVQWNSATSATLTIGIAALGTQYVSAIDVKAATVGRVTLPAATLAQLQKMADNGTDIAVVATVAVVGATSAGQTRVNMSYQQTTLWDTN